MPILNNDQGKLIEEMKNQLLIVFLKRLGGSVSIPVDEIDDTSQDLMSMSVDSNRIFKFKLSKKS